MNKKQCLALLVATLLASSGSLTAATIDLNSVIPGASLRDAPGQITFYLYESRDAEQPIASQTFLAGEWQASPKGPGVDYRVNFTALETDSYTGMWYQATADGAARSERQQIRAGVSDMYVAGQIETGVGVRFPGGGLQTEPGITSETDPNLAAHTGDASAHHTRYSDGEAVNAIKAADGPGSGLDADLLDGQQATAFATTGNLATHAVDTDAHHTRYSDGEAVSAILAADGAGSGLDADLLDGQQATAFATSAHDHNPDYVNVTGDTMTDALVVNNGATNDYAAKGIGDLGPTNGYLGVQGTTDFDGVLSADWSGDEIGVAGISTGSSATDNYGVLGHANTVGVRGEYSESPTSNYAELGKNGTGIEARGETYAADFINDISVADTLGNQQFHLDADGLGGAGVLRMYDGVGTATANKRVEIIANDSTTDGSSMNFYNASGTKTIELDGDEGADEGWMQFRNGAGVATITIDGDVAGDGRITTQELSITGGSDLSEQFDINSATARVEPGMLVSIDPLNPGQLVLSREAYDRKVAGIVSGAGGVKPGMMMGQEGSIADGEFPVALTGRVYAMVDAGKGAIQPGDLLTTSDVPGYAMKVTDHQRAAGSIIGKAMTPLKDGQGLVLVLVSLQ